MIIDSINVNLNTKCKVELTEYGKKTYKKYFENIGCSKMKRYFYDQIKNNILETRLHRIMNIFGDCLYVGNPNIPFENNKIILVEGE